MEEWRDADCDGILGAWGLIYPLPITISQQSAITSQHKQAYLPARFLPAPTPNPTKINDCGESEQILCLSFPGAIMVSHNEPLDFSQQY